MKCQSQKGCRCHQRYGNKQTHKWGKNWWFFKADEAYWV